MEVACYCSRSLKKPEAKIRWRSGRQGACVSLSPNCRHSCQQQLPLNMALEYGAISRPSISCLKLGTWNQSPPLPQAAALHLLIISTSTIRHKTKPTKPNRLLHHQTTSSFYSYILSKCLILKKAFLNVFGIAFSFEGEGGRMTPFSSSNLVEVLTTQNTHFYPLVSAL